MGGGGGGGGVGKILGKIFFESGLFLPGLSWGGGADSVHCD